MAGDPTKRRVGQPTVFEDEQALWSGLSADYGDLDKMPAKYRAMAELGRLVRAAAEEEAVAAIEWLADNPGVPVKEAIAKVRALQVGKSSANTDDLHTLLLNTLNKYRDSHTISDKDTLTAVETLADECRQRLLLPEDSSGR